MVKFDLDVIDNKEERHYEFDMDMEELVELIKTRNEDEDLVIDSGDKTVVIPVYIMDKSIIRICDTELKTE